MFQDRCPKCHQGKIFRVKGNLLRLKAPVMEEQCSHCHYRFEKEPGYFLGAMYISYGLGVLQLIITYLLLAGILSLPFLFGALFIVLIAFSLWNFRLARIIWIHLFPY